MRWNIRMRFAVLAVAALTLIVAGCRTPRTVDYSMSPKGGNDDSSASVSYPTPAREYLASATTDEEGPFTTQPTPPAEYSVSPSGDDNNDARLASLPTPYPTPTTGYHVSPDGSDSNSGTLNSPWKTVAYALTKLSPGDTLYLRGGTYYQSGISTSLQGTASAPITIASYPGERAVIDGALPYFASAPNTEWELVNDAIKLYRSKRTFSSTTVRAWLLDYDSQIVQYAAAANLESTNYGPVSGTTPLYIGPGLQRRSDGRIYIRLQYNPNDLTDAKGNALQPVPVDTDPGNNRIAVYSASTLMKLRGAAYLNFKDLTLAHAVTLLDASDSHDIEISNSRFDYGTYGINARSAVSEFNVHDSEFNNGFPPYTYWTDVKNTSRESAEAYPEFQSDAITGYPTAFRIERNLFRDSLDGIHLKDGVKDTVVLNNSFIRMHDDAMEIWTGVSNVEVSQNMFWHVGSGVSIDPSSATPGPVYIHHNVIDNSAYQRGGREGNYRQSDWPVWTVIDPIAKHGSGSPASWWRIYQNTIVTRRSGYDGHGTVEKIVPSSEKYVYNNIFYALDDRIIFRDDLASSGAYYDGNVVYRQTRGTSPLFVRFGDGADYDSLADFRRASGTDWERNGLEIDPGFTLVDADDTSFDRAAIWDRYRPTNLQVFTRGASYEGLNWPGTEDMNYRGAVAPRSGE